MTENKKKALNRYGRRPSETLWSECSPVDLSNSCILRGLLLISPLDDLTSAYGLKQMQSTKSKVKSCYLEFHRCSLPVITSCGYCAHSGTVACTLPRGVPRCELGLPTLLNFEEVKRPVALTLQKCAALHFDSPAGRPPLIGAQRLWRRRPWGRHLWARADGSEASLWSRQQPLGGNPTSTTRLYLCTVLNCLSSMGRPVRDGAKATSMGYRSGNIKHLLQISQRKANALEPVCVDEADTWWWRQRGPFSHLTLNEFA